MPNDNKLAQLVAPQLALWSASLKRLKAVMPDQDGIEGYEFALNALAAIESQVQADLIEKEIAAPATELSVLLDLLTVAAERRNITDVKHYRAQILKVARQ